MGIWLSRDAGRAAGSIRRDGGATVGLGYVRDGDSDLTRAEYSIAMA